MGMVYKAEDTNLKRTVALKFLSPTALGNAEQKTRFIREAQAVASLDHPNICTVHEIDEVEGQIFISMAYVEGESLKDKIKPGPLKLKEVLDLAIEVSEGLREAHAKGIIHRDINSSNILVNMKSRAKIMDFGLAKIKGGPTVAQEKTVLGTGAYMSPQQAQGDEEGQEAPGHDHPPPIEGVTPVRPSP